MIDRKHCVGCRDDFYNRSELAPNGRCWNRATAKVITRYAIGTWTQPTQPGAYTETRKPDCYHQQGTHYHNKLPDFVKCEDVVRSRRA
jgi:hypothetical protein